MRFQLTYDSLEKFGANNGGLLLVGHGTRSLDGQQQLLALAHAMQMQCPAIRMQPCFLELAQPSIEAGVKSLADHNIKRLLIAPILLFTAAHAKDDIPNAVASISRDCEIDVVGQSSPLNLHPQALELSQLRFSEAISSISSDDQNELATAKTALVMIGRGTSQAEAREAMRQFVRLRCECFPIAWSTVGFFAGDEATVAEALERAATQTVSKTIVVQPHLLFEGDLSNELRAMVAEYQAKYSHKNWLLARPLGADERIGATYLALAEQAASAYLQ